MTGRLTVLFVMLLLPLASSAQKVQTISGECTYITPSTVSLEDAKQAAVSRARINALADAFGTHIRSATTALIANGGENSEIDFSTLAASEVRGEWLSDTRDPEIEIGYEQQMNSLVIRARVWGKAREIVSAPADIIVKTLRNGTDQKFQSDQFQSGDDLYLYFRTPVPGSLAVYLLDETQTVYCLLPYRNDKAGAVRVENNREYIFFSPDCADRQTAPIVDEYVLTSDKKAITNYIYVVFSPNEFTKANDLHTGKSSQPRQTSAAEFRQWLEKCRIRDSKMTVKQLPVLIKK